MEVRPVEFKDINVLNQENIGKNNILKPVPEKERCFGRSLTIKREKGNVFKPRKASLFDEAGLVKLHGVSSRGGIRILDPQLFCIGEISLAKTPHDLTGKSFRVTYQGEYLMMLYHDNDDIETTLRTEDSNKIRLRNKKSRFDKKSSLMNDYCQGPVLSRLSKKNFQMVHATLANSDQEAKILLEFVRKNTSDFEMYISYPFSEFAAFATILPKLL